jgi:hypothetical protein
VSHHLPRGTCTRQQLDELAGLGFTSQQIGQAAGMTPETVDALADGIALPTKAGAHAAVTAFRWLNPDIDEVVIERYRAGDPPAHPIRVEERREIVRQMVVLDRVSHREIAERLGVLTRSVQRIANGLGLVEHRQDEAATR